MQIVHTQKFIRTSPRKLSLVADVVRNMDPARAIEILPHVEKRAAEPLLKVIKTAVANAKDRRITGDLVIKEIQVNTGPSLKRGRAVSKGRWHPYKRRMSHVRIVLETKTKGGSRTKVQASQSAKSKRDDTAGMKSLPAVSKSKVKKGKKEVRL